MSDLIDRQQAIDACMKYNGYGTVWACIMGDIKLLPSAQPERKKGRWIPVINGRGGFECNQCHCYAPSYQDGVEWLSAFCPNCGADMRGDESEDT